MAYPASLDELTDGIPSTGVSAMTVLGSVDFRHSANHRAIATAVEAVEGELGLNPSGAHDTVAARFTADEEKLNGIEAGADVTDAANVNAAGAVMESDYDANTILAATSDNTPAALTVAEQRIVGRITGGNIDDLDGGDLQAILDDDIEAWHYVGETGEPAFENSWENLGFSQPVLAFRKIGNVVYIAGTIWEGGGAFSTDTIFTLPSGYRPSAATECPSVSSDFSGNTIFSAVAVTTGGAVAPPINPGAGTYTVVSFTGSGTWGFVLDPSGT